jgi:hypothetical protein
MSIENGKWQSLNFPFSVLPMHQILAIFYFLRFTHAVKKFPIAVLLVGQRIKVHFKFAIFSLEKLILKKPVVYNVIIVCDLFRSEIHILHSQAR